MQIVFINKSIVNAVCIKLCAVDLMLALDGANHFTYQLVRPELDADRWMNRHELQGATVLIWPICVMLTALIKTIVGCGSHAEIHPHDEGVLSDADR